MCVCVCVCVRKEREGKVREIEGVYIVGIPKKLSIKQKWLALDLSDERTEKTLLQKKKKINE